MTVAQEMRKSKTSTIVIGIVLVLLGLVFCFAPEFTLAFITTLTGIAFLVAGIVGFVNYITQTEKSVWDVLLGIVGVVLGLILLFQPQAAISFVLGIIGILIFLSGVVDIVDALQANKLGAPRWSLFLLLGIVTALLGVAVFVPPVFFRQAILVLAGIALVFDGVSEIVVGASL